MITLHRKLKEGADRFQGGVTNDTEGFTQVTTNRMSGNPIHYRVVVSGIQWVEEAKVFVGLYVDPNDTRHTKAGVWNLVGKSMNHIAHGDLTRDVDKAKDCVELTVEMPASLAYELWQMLTHGNSAMFPIAIDPNSDKDYQYRQEFNNFMSANREIRQIK